MNLAKLVDQIKPWEKLPQETSVAYGYFAIYRDLGLRRTFSDTARKAGVRVPLISALAERNNWRARVDAWDTYLDRLRQERQIEEARQMDERHISLATCFQDKVRHRLETMTEDETERIEHKDLINWAMQSCKLERQARHLDSEKESGVRVNINNTNRNRNTAASHAQADAEVKQIHIIETVVRTRSDVQQAKANPQADIVDGE